MTRIAWDQIGSRTFETGVDHGVLFVNGKGVPWSGLTAVKESKAGGEAKSYYVDGVRYANRVLMEEFQATIEAYTYPEEFAQCDGTRQWANGLYLTHQRRKEFGFSYRTRVGNDVEGLEHGYKIHLVYNALAQPADRAYSSLGDKIDPMMFSWSVMTRPPVLDFVPTAHLIIDSRSTPDGLLSQIQDVLYGTTQQDSRLPTVGEVAFMFSSYENPALDDGLSDDPTYFAFDGGSSSSPVTEIIDGGTL